MKRLVVILVVSLVLVNLLGIFFQRTIGMETTPSWTSSGDDQELAYFGHSVASAGDVNGDGFGDVIIGATYYDTANYNAGKAYLYLSNSTGLETSPSWTSSGDDQAHARFGWSVASAGDVNGDSYSDVIIGATYYDTANSDAGKAYLYLGSSSGLQASPSWTSSGDDQAYALFGRSVASAGDINGDGYSDVIIGASCYDTTNTHAGKVYLYLGSSSGLQASPSWTSSGDDKVYARFGCSVASVGDVNGDGYSDVIIGANSYDTANASAGKAYLYLGNSTGLQTSPSWTSSGDDQTEARFGFSVASAGDVNGDGYSDVIIGAHCYDTVNTNAGKAYLYLSNSTGLETSTSWTSSGDDQANAYFGYSVASAGDVNGDGCGDVIIGVWLYDTANTDAGKAYLYLSNSTGLETSTSWTSSGDDQTEARFGHSVASAGDVNGDGYSDVIIGAYLYDTANIDAGKAYLYSGGPFGLPVADAGPDQESFNGRAVNFDGSNSYDPDGTIVNWTWDFGDGIIGYGETTTHVYSTYGIYNATLTVKDNDGRTGTDIAIVTIWQNGHDLSILKVQSPHKVRMGSTKTVVVWVENLGSYDDYGLLSLTITAPDGTEITLTTIVKEKDGTSLNIGNKVRITFSVTFNQRGTWTFCAHVDISDSNGNVNPFPLKDCNPANNDDEPTYGTDCK